MFPMLECFVAYPSGEADGEMSRSLVLRFLLYSLIELFLIPVYHAFKKSPGSVPYIGRIKAHARGLKIRGLYFTLTKKRSGLFKIAHFLVETIRLC